MERIIRTVATEDELPGVYVFGLNTLGVNRVEVERKEDPRMLFLKSLTDKYSCSAHTGNLYDLVNTPNELFGPTNGENPYVECRIGVYQGDYYAFEDWPVFRPCFFPKTSSSLWQAETTDGTAHIYEALDWGALALYVEPRADSRDNMKSLLSEPLTSQEALRAAIAKVYELVILTNHDGDYFTAYSQSSSHFTLLSEAIDTAENAISSTTWFRQHAESLIWDGEYNMCLTLPELLRNTAK
jgi:hypothetical protein